MASLPPIYVLPIHLTTEELHDIEDQIQDLHGELTYDIYEARIVLGKVATKKRAELELRVRKLWTVDISSEVAAKAKAKKRGIEDSDSPRKKRKVAVVEGYSTTEDEDTKSMANLSIEHTTASKTHEIVDLTQDEAPVDTTHDTDIVQVVKLDWLNECVRGNALLDIKPFVIYSGSHKERPQVPNTPPRRTPVVMRTSPRETPKSQHILAEKPLGSDILERARADAGYVASQGQDPHTMAAPHGARRMGKSTGRPNFRHSEAPKQVPKLMELITEEYESNSDQEIPPAPDWVKQRFLYACQRSAPFEQPNEDFINELKKIRLARILTNDEIGVRAYSTSIASLAAYPFKVVNPREILRLPGCDVKIANLWVEWKNGNGKIQAAEEAENDPTLKILNTFYEIWGVGATTAREFYYDKGWNDLDDIVEYGWSTLNRVQQIGVKYYDEFQQKIPRPEVEFIAEKVHEHAIKVRDDGIEIIIVGGYRRGKKESGDVDMIVSHRHLEKTAGLVQDIVESLEQEGWITHTLTLSLTSTHRNQSTLPFKTSTGVHGSGFDTLDKALVVWQDPVWPGMEETLRKDPKAKNPNVHRRVDIIISPWRTVGCAVLGWTSGTTFQRDMRRYARNVKGWKFDSSGVRDRATGEVVELEGPDGVSGSMVDAEKKVFEGFGLTYREPSHRCTG
jgi:DNA polymerase IV